MSYEQQHGVGDMHGVSRPKRTRDPNIEQYEAGVQLLGVRLYGTSRGHLHQR